MEDLLREIAGYTALTLETVAVALVAYGAVAATVALVREPADPRVPFRRRKLAFLTLGAWLILGLEFELAADVVRTVIAPTWRELAELGAIAVIRTFLNYFLEKDVERLANAESAPRPAPEGRATAP